MLIHALLVFHILGFISWFAGLFYLPRLFVYHSMSPEISIKNQFLIMEKKLYFYIMNPAMLVTLISGYSLMELKYGYLSPGGQPHYPLWLHIKLVLVIFLILFHVSCGYFFKKFKNQKPTPGHRFFRIFNEIPTILLILIALCVVFQPL